MICGKLIANQFFFFATWLVQAEEFIIYCLISFIFQGFVLFFKQFRNIWVKSISSVYLVWSCSPSHRHSLWPWRHEGSCDNFISWSNMQGTGTERIPSISKEVLGQYWSWLHGHFCFLGMPCLMPWIALQEGTLFPLHLDLMLGLYLILWVSESSVWSVARHSVLFSSFL